MKAFRFGLPFPLFFFDLLFVVLQYIIHAFIPHGIDLPLLLARLPITHPIILFPPIKYTPTPELNSLIE